MSSTKRARTSVPSVTDILRDPLTQLASEYWAAGCEGPNAGRFDEGIVARIYEDSIEVNDRSSIQILDFSGYLENYLWLHFPQSINGGAVPVSLAHVFSIIFIVNEKALVNSSVFNSLTADEAKFKILIDHVVELFFIGGSITPKQLPAYLKFFVNLYQCMENGVVRKCCLRYVFLPIWESLSPARLQLELATHTPLKRHWGLLQSAKLKNTEPVQATVEEAPVAAKGRRGKKTAAAPSSATTVESTAKSSPTSAVSRECSWLPGLIQLFLRSTSDFGPDSSSEKVVFLERFAELLVDLLSQLATRRFLNTLLDDMNVVVKCKQSTAYRAPQGETFARMVDLVDYYMQFPVHDQSGKPLAPGDVTKAHHLRIHKLQQIAFADFNEDLRDLIFSSVGELSKEQALRKHLLQLTATQLIDLTVKLGCITHEEVALLQAPAGLAADSMDTDASEKKDIFPFLLNVLVRYFIPRQSQVDAIKQLPLFPTESMLWDGQVIPQSASFQQTGDKSVLALPKLNLQFLTMQDYLLRSFELYRLESAYEIREDLVDAIKRTGPKATGGSGTTVFGGWARMALPLVAISIDHVSKPRLGEVVPDRVECSIVVDLSRFTGVVRSEWESLREHDVVFLVCIENPQAEAGSTVSDYESERTDMAQGKKPKKTKDFSWVEEALDFPIIYGVKHVRGGEIFELRDDSNNLINDFRSDKRGRPSTSGPKRKFRIRLDPAQYYTDLKSGQDCYASMNLLVRRKSKENNFKSVLESARDVMNTESLGQAVPSWLHDVLLGHHNPAAAHFRNLSAFKAKSDSDMVEETHNYVDTFLDSAHLIESFPKAKQIIFIGDDGTETALAPSSAVNLSPAQLASLPAPPYRLVITRPAKNSAMDSSTDVIRVGNSLSNSLLQGPYPEDEPPKNAVRFTSAQVAAIRSGMNEGLTMVVGPPGTGKTDTVVQIVCNLYHNFPNQKILLIAHSNAALNDLFEKIMQRNVDQRHLVRLGSGEQDLRSKSQGRFSGEEFTKHGRISWSLSRRIFLLSQVQRLGESLQVAGGVGDVGYTCETAQYFYRDKIQSRIASFRQAISGFSTVDAVEQAFPFTEYFSDTPEPLFTGESLSNDVGSAEGCFRHIDRIFEELQDYRAFELLRTQTHRSDYIVTKQARIIAMTCTHAAITRRRLLELGFKYDSVIMEESAQILELESLIPLLLQQNNVIDGCRLKRVVLVGDHYQLPPVVQHMALQKYSKLDQSMFARFVRLGVPTILLDKQGRARPELAALYSWRYSQPGAVLGNLDFIRQDPSFQCANPGFLHTFQLVNVSDFKGEGESCPSPYFYQNLGEAEYVVAVYQYMRLLGYPAEKISIITTYNGQKHLIRDVIAQRCRNPIFGSPATVSTVDKFQGQQNDYILLSLVRTESVGHLRDIRRLVVALSRARLGLYVFCRQALFENCFELTTAFSMLLSRPTTLELVANESFEAPLALSSEKETQNRSGAFEVKDVTAMGILVYEMAQQRLAVVRSTSAPLIAPGLNAVVNDRSVVDDVGDNENPKRMKVDEGP